MNARTLASIRGRRGSVEYEAVAVKLGEMEIPDC
jgi:hypothetical protein